MASTGNYFTRIYERAADMVNQVRHVSSDETRPLLHGQGQRSYQGTEDDSIPVPKPRPVVTPVKVEAKVWFANERTWISWLRASLLLGTLALALFNSATCYDPKTSTDPMVPDYEGRPRAAKAIRTFGLVYALISAFVLLWGLYSYQRRVTLIKMRWPGSFGMCGLFD